MITDRAIEMFRPMVVFVVGIAGGLMRDIELGDVVVGTRIYDYQAGTDTDAGFLTRPQAWDAPYDLCECARQVARADRWTDRVAPRSPGRRPAVYFRPIAAGEVVLNSRNTALAQQLRRHFNDAAVIEMESAGAAFAAHLNRTRILTVRGISDRANGLKLANDRHGSQHRAARHAAAFTVALISALGSFRP